MVIGSRKRWENVTAMPLERGDAALAMLLMYLSGEIHAKGSRSGKLGREGHRVNLSGQPD
jgi:hypothetical protein